MKNIFKIYIDSITANPPQTHCTKSIPIYGIADNRLVITVAPVVQAYLQQKRLLGWAQTNLAKLLLAKALLLKRAFFC